MASGTPLSPSTMAMRMSSTPRVFNSFMTRSQNLAPSFCSSHRPRISLVPSAPRTPNATYTPGLIAHQPFVPDFDAQSVEKDQRVDGFEGAALPGGDFVQDGVRHRADQIRRDVDAIEIAKMSDDFSHAHAAGVHRDNFLVEARKPPLVLGDQVRIEARLPISRHIQLYPSGVEDTTTVFLP